MGQNVQIGPQTLNLQLDQIFVLKISQKLYSKLSRKDTKMMTQNCKCGWQAYVSKAKSNYFFDMFVHFCTFLAEYWVLTVFKDIFSGEILNHGDINQQNHKVHKYSALFAPKSISH